MQLSWKVGGQQGEGIDSTGETLAMALCRKGYFLYGYRHFSSRIKGGHSNTKLRISDTPVGAMSQDLDILVAFDQESIDFNAHELIADGVVLADEKFSPKLPDGISAKLIPVPFTRIAESVGVLQMKNMVSVGASSALLGLSPEIFRDVINERFLRKGQTVVDKNMAAIAEGSQFVSAMLSELAHNFTLGPADGQRRPYMIGNEAIAIGALMAGARIMAAYPITPSSEIMEYLVQKLPDFGGTVVQTEDEIAAINMAIGAGYAGVRSLTASAGPGLSLMTEAIGLAGMTETPVVIINTQRGGPSTGLPTKQEQSDLLAMLYSTHGEIPKIVLAPSTVEECFYDTVEAFNLAEQYQCPVIILSDLALSLGKQTLEPLDYHRVEIKRGKLVGEDVELPPLGDSELFLRYQFTEDGVSLRVLPGKKDGIHHVTGVEHAQTGRPLEDSLNRRQMMDKRLKKLNNSIVLKEPVALDIRQPETEILLVGFISTRGAISEVIDLLQRDGVKASHLHLRQIMPFPRSAVEPHMRAAQRILVIENNATGQLASVLRMNIGMSDKIMSLCKYDGTPFIAAEIYAHFKEVFAHGYA